MLGSVRIWISRRASPTSRTSPTPDTVSRRFLITFSASEERVFTSAVSLSTATETTGMALKSMRWMMGSSMSRGKSARMALILAWASCWAVWVLVPSRNSAITAESPSVVVELRCRMPGMVLRVSSMRLVTSRSTVSGEAPG